MKIYYNYELVIEGKGKYKLNYIYYVDIFYLKKNFNYFIDRIVDIRIFNLDTSKKAKYLFKKFIAIFFYLIYKYGELENGKVIFGFSNNSISIHLNYLYRNVKLNNYFILFYFIKVLKLKVNFHNLFSIIYFTKVLKNRYNLFFAPPVIQININNFNVDFYFSINNFNERFVEISFKSDNRVSVYLWNERNKSLSNNLILKSIGLQYDYLFDSDRYCFKFLDYKYRIEFVIK